MAEARKPRVKRIRVPKLREIPMTDEKDAEIAKLKAQLEVAERIATQEHHEMISQDSIHADEIQKLHDKLDRVLTELLEVQRRIKP